MTATPYIDTYWVIKDQLLAGAYPGGSDEEITRQKIRALLNENISCIIDLTRPEDPYFPFQSYLQEEAGEFSQKVEWFNFPIADYDAPSEAMIVKILDMIDESLAKNEKVYVHCIAGIGRTGTVVGCYLARHGLTGAEALKQLEFLRKDVASWWRRSPESEEQIDFVVKWQTGK